MRQTFEEQIGHHLDGLYSAALCFTLDEDHAEELLQEASIRAFHEYAHWRRDADFKDRMLEVVVSIFLRRQRKQGRDPFRSDAEPFEDALRPDREVQPFPPPGTRGYHLLVSWMNRMWGRLEAGDRLVLWLGDVEGVSHTRMAEMTGLAVEAVRARHYRARLNLSREAAGVLSRHAAGAEG